MSERAEYILERVFDASRALVWRAWTDPKLLARWYGPRVDTIIHKFELKPGGVWLNEMRMGDKSDLSKSTFAEVIPEERLVWRQSSTDSDWNVISNPMMPDWPRTVLTTVTFADNGQQTRVKLVWEPFEATEAEIACFAGAIANMGKGWESGFGIIEEILAELQAGS